MDMKLLLKGFEVELFTGRPNGEHVGVAVEVSQELQEFVKEPDQRNLEYITKPSSDYSLLRESLLAPRRKLRSWLQPKGLTLLPGSTLSLGDSKRFERSDLSNPYHDLIETSYGTKVVTASIHINLGLEDLHLLFAALRLVRCEASLLLALSASSPFLDNVPTGMHSQRWSQFPLNPNDVPLFLDYEHYVRWVENSLLSGVMRNERHLWTSVRPNGPRRPYELNRLELRICDLITDPSVLLALTALLELRVLSLIKEPEKLDPLKSSELSEIELAVLSDKNDLAASKDSLDATLSHWRDGSLIICRDWIKDLVEEVTPLAKELSMLDQLSPLASVLRTGNQSMQWLQDYSQGKSIQSVLKEGISAMALEEMQASRTEMMF